MTAEALLVGEACDADNHGVPVLGAGEERERCGLAPDLVSRVVQVREVLDLGYRQHPGEAGAEREAEDGLLIQRRVEHPAGAEGALQPPRHPVDATLAADVLPEDDHVWPPG